MFELRSRFIAPASPTRAACTVGESRSNNLTGDLGPKGMPCPNVNSERENEGSHSHVATLIFEALTYRKI